MTLLKDEPPTIGDNSIDGAKLKSFVERIERLEEEKASIAEDIKSVYKEAKDAAFDKIILRRLIKRRKEDPRMVAMEEQVMRAYLKAIGAA